MRRFPARPAIPKKPTERYLRAKTKEIFGIASKDTRKERARAIFDASRVTQWFAPILTNLRQLADNLCMYCSSNEPSQVEHYCPIAVHPERAMSYRNYLWTCDICNRTYKGEKFPPINHPGARILNPLKDDVWEHFFIDEQFGRLLRRVDPTTRQALPRAASTCDVVGIDREAVQIKRGRRFKALKNDARKALEDFAAGICAMKEIQELIAEHRTLPFQSDVADYFLNGPGRRREPFRSLLLAAGETVL